MTGAKEGKQVHVCNDGLEQGLCRDSKWTAWDMNESLKVSGWSGSHFWLANF
jgi:hypothetical protein